MMSCHLPSAVPACRRQSIAGRMRLLAAGVLALIFAGTSPAATPVDSPRWTTSSRLINVSTRDDFNDWQVELFREFMVALIVSWNRHDCTRSVRSKDIISDPDWKTIT